MQLQHDAKPSLVISGPEFPNLPRNELRDAGITLQIAGSQNDASGVIPSLGCVAEPRPGMASGDGGPHFPPTTSA